MADTVFEGMFLLDSNRFGRDPDGVSGQIPAMIQAAGGEVLVSRLWEERRLAYAVKGRRKGTYWLTYFRLDGPKLADLKRRSQLNDDILRVLFIRIDPRIVGTLVEHARAGTVRPASERTADPHADKADKEDAAADAEDADEADSGEDEPEQGDEDDSE